MRRIFFMVLLGSVFSLFGKEKNTPPPSPPASSPSAATTFNQKVQNFRTATMEGFHNSTSIYTWVTGSKLENPLQGQSFNVSEVTEKLKPNCRTLSVSVSSK